MAERAFVLRLLQAGWLKPLLFLVFLVVIWDLAIRLFNIPPYQIPAPRDVIITLWEEWPKLLAEAWPTTQATVWGFLLSAAFGIPVAVLIAGSRPGESHVYPKVLSAFLLGFFPVVVSAVQGFKSVEPDMLDLARAMEANRLQIFRMVSFPHALTAIFAGLKVSITLAVVGAVVGEFVGSNSGIGFVLQRSIGNFELPTMFAALVVLALIGVLLFWLLDVLERLAIPWHASQRHDLIIAA